MRPIRLEMTAFGSYAEHTVVPFDRLRSGLYLITGDTGAGKTTIFDAIMFALYGTASGTDRNDEMMHCDHVSKGVDTVVSLTFAQSGKVHRVERTIHFSKKRGSKEEYGDPKVSAVLQEEGTEAIEGASKVSTRCQELLGMDKDQFRRIVMLAQGEFRKFLKADSTEKNEILSKLFDHSEYLYYQNLLAETRAALQKQRGEQAVELERLMRSDLHLPEDTSDEDRLLYLPGHPQLLENLSTLVARAEAEHQEIGARSTRQQQQIERLNRERGAAEQVNRQLTELEEKRHRLRLLEEAAPEMEDLAHRIDRADAALHTAYPALKAAAEAKKAAERTREEIAKQQEQLSALEESLRLATEARAADPEDTARQNALQSQAAQIGQQLERYGVLNAQKKELAEAQRLFEAASAEQRALEERHRQAKERISALEKELAAAGDTGVEQLRLETLHKARQGYVQELTGNGGIVSRVQQAKALEESLALTRQKLERSAAQALQANEQHQQLYRALLSGQAGLLARELCRRIEKEGGASCPVCGVHHDAIGAGFAPLAADTPSQERVDEARAAFEAKDTQRQRCQRELDRLQGDLNAAREAALEALRRLPVTLEGWEQPAQPGWLEDVVARFRSEELQTARELNTAKQQHARAQEWSKEAEQLRTSLEGLAAAAGEQAEKAAAQQQAIIRLDTAIKETEKTLTYASGQEAAAQQRRLLTEAEGLRRLLEKRQKACEDAMRLRDTAVGTLREKEASLREQDTQQENARQQAKKVLAETGFESPAAVREVLEGFGAMNGEDWLRLQRKTVADHDHETKATRERIRELEEATRGKVMQPLERLDEQIRQENEVQNGLNAQHSECFTRLSGYRGVLNGATRLKGSLKDTDSAWQRIDRLGTLATGESSEGGKLSFERYVMGSLFREVLEMANRRMDVMSGGKYELIHKTTVRRSNASAGLEIEVLDVTTGQQRPAGSLSGGEAFFTSLALALGLSDVVQNHAGGRKLDALFIDEGFGTLSEGVLDKALEVLGQLTEGNRLIGIISHVDKLDESIAQKIRVKGSEKGSTLVLEGM